MEKKIRSVKEIREGLGMVQEDFAKLVGVRVKTISVWERTNTFPISPNTMRVLEELDAKVDKLEAENG